MKKVQLLFILLFTLSALISRAQIHKGAVFLGGNVSGSYQKTKSGGVNAGKQNGVTISPVFGKASKENLVWGGSLSLAVSHAESENGNPNSQDYSLFGGGVFVRKYKMIGNSNFYIFLQGGLNIDYSRQEYDYPTNPQVNIFRRYHAGVYAYPGISYALSKRFQLESGFNNLVSLNYFHELNKYSIGPSDFSSYTNGITLESSLSNASALYVGFRVLLN